ncbi:TetR/AcrR family transcriptional regulator [Brenneria izbisi]|uniref:TetR/AcrR family transcriptional regulator n=1 Tax=Brenneria izbisi TaxID=2939450 RepID=A0AA41XYY4_9GAMM|nr:TetR/AcrR family transcriptional regulator [Brenneria izbisi]MCV9880204.1 TetR/AcrR family transcriptional regulator [Brenneria izbisi]MCV9883520.1 TetR/AcrR family transcriptional regulator [Brenneria izbisi]
MALELTIMKNKLSIRGRPKSSELPIRVEFILDIATQVFLESGFSKAKVIDIAKRAGASKTTLYTLYPTKDALFSAVISKKIEMLEKQLNDSLKFEEELSLLLVGFGRKLIDTFLQDESRALFNIIITEKHCFPELADFFWQAGPGKCIKTLSQCLEVHPEFTGNNVTVAAETFISLCWGTYLLNSLITKNFHMSEEEINNHLIESVHVFSGRYCRKA